MVATLLVLKKGYELGVLAKCQITVPNYENTAEIRWAGSHSSGLSTNDRSVRIAVLKQEKSWSEMVVVATVLSKQVRYSA